MASTVEMGRLPVYDPVSHSGEKSYFTQSYWRQPITDYTPFQHPTIPEANSRNWIVNLCSQMAFDPNTGAPIKTSGGLLQQGKAWISTSTCGTPVFIVPWHYPKRAFDLSDKTVVGWQLLSQMLKAGVPAPLDIELTGTCPDGYLTIYQPSTDTMWELYRVSRSTPGGPIDRAKWGGIITGVSTHPGTYRNLNDAAGKQIEHRQWGCDATSTALGGGLTEIDHLINCASRGVSLQHAIPMQLGHAQHTPIPFVWPATRGDGDMYDAPHVIPEGACITFPPGSDFTRVPREFLPVALAIQQYGAYPRDKTGQGCALVFREYPGGVSSTGKGWKDALPIYKTQGDAAWRYMATLPWHQAVVVAPPAH